MEKRVYAINVNARNVEDITITQLSDEDFISKAEEQGTVYSLKGFQDAFNNDEISSEYFYIRIL